MVSQARERAQKPAAPVAHELSDDDVVGITGEAEVEAEPEPAPRKRIGPVTTKDKRPVQDLDKNEVDPNDIEGAEAAPNRDDAELNDSNSLEIRGVRYPLPRMGPLVMVAMDRSMQRQRVAFEKRDRLTKAGYSQAAANAQAGVIPAYMEFLELVWDLGQETIPRSVLVSLTISEIQELQAQFRPFDPDEA